MLNTVTLVMLNFYVLHSSPFCLDNIQSGKQCGSRSDGFVRIRLADLDLQHFQKRINLSSAGQRFINYNIIGKLFIGYMAVNVL